MSKPCPNFQMKIYASTQVILEFFPPERAALSLWGGNFLNEQCCCQTKNCSLFSLLERCVTHETFQPRTSTASLAGAAQEGTQAAFPPTFPDSLLNKLKVKCYSLSSDEMVGRQDFIFFFPALWRRAFVFSLEQHWESVSKLTTHLYLKSFISIRVFFSGQVITWICI